MEDFNVTKLPFTSLSRENWMLLKKLDKDSAYDAIQMIANYVLEGVEPSYDGIAGMVAEQVISVINRKGQKSYNSKNNLGKANAAKQAKKEQQQPKVEQSATIPTCDISKQEKVESKKMVEDIKPQEQPKPSLLWADMDIDEIVDYLKDAEADNGKHYREREMNRISRESGIYFMDILNAFNSR